MKTLTQLWKLEFSVHRGSFAKLCVWKFLKDLPSLELVNVHVDELTTSQVDRFVKIQGQLDEWAITSNETMVVFRRQPLKPPSADGKGK